jgi:rubrerythrin
MTTQARVLNSFLILQYWCLENKLLNERIIIYSQGKELINLLSRIPINLEGIKKENLDKEILRAGIIAELDAINLYEQMAAMTENGNIKRILLDIAKEEKTHVGEFQALLLINDKEQEKELEEGKKEVDELSS